MIIYFRLLCIVAEDLRQGECKTKVNTYSCFIGVLIQCVTKDGHIQIRICRHVVGLLPGMAPTLLEASLRWVELELSDRRVTEGESPIPQATLLLVVLDASLARKEIYSKEVAP